MASATYREIFPLSVREGGLNISCAEKQNKWSQKNLKPLSLGHVTTETINQNIQVKSETVLHFAKVRSPKLA